MIGHVKAQDIHFSQFNRSYLNLNPALTGYFDGDYRFNGNYRNQWSAVSEPFRTFSFAADAKAPIDKYSNFNLGFILFNDEAGLGGLNTLQAGISVSYTHKLNTDSTLVLNGGLFSGINSRSINYDQFSFDRQYNGRLFNPNRENGENFNQNSFTNFNLHAGLNLNYLVESRKRYNIGFSLFNLVSPNQSFQGSNIPLDMRSNLYIGADHLLSDKVDILPSILYSNQGKFNELVFGSNIRYRYKSSRNLYGGIWYRNADAIIASAGFDYYQWNFGISYDINTSDLESASNNRGGLELSVTYIWKVFKPTFRKYKACPKFL